MSIDELKRKVVPCIREWGNRRIDGLVRANPNLHIASVYMKRALVNITEHRREDIERGLEAASVFLADESGNVDMGTIADDLMTMFKSMESREFELGFIRGSVGKGQVCVDIPDNILTNLLFGNGERLTITADDFNELKEMIKE